VKPTRQFPTIDDHPLRGHERAMLEERLMMAVAAGMPPEVEAAHRRMYGLPMRREPDERRLQHRAPVQPTRGAAGWPPRLVATIQTLMRRQNVADEPTRRADELQPTPRRKHRRTQSWTVGDKPESAGPTGMPILTEREVLQWLRRFRYEAQYRRGPGRVPLRVLADVAGLHRSTPYAALMRGKISEHTRCLLSPAIVAIREGRLRFRRLGQEWQIERTETPAPSIPIQTISAPPGSIFGGPPLPPSKTG
jgi:hypothetical protein